MISLSSWHFDNTFIFCTAFRKPKWWTHYFSFTFSKSLSPKTENILVFVAYFTESGPLLPSYVRIAALALVVYLNGSHNTASTSLLSDHLPVTSLNMWGSDLYSCCLSKPTHRRKQLLPRLWSSKVTWSNTPGSMPHSARIPHVLCPQFALPSSRHSIFCLYCKVRTNL